jgi:hypothetical protein
VKNTKKGRCKRNLKCSWLTNERPQENTSSECSGTEIFGKARIRSELEVVEGFVEQLGNRTGRQKIRKRDSNLKGLSKQRIKASFVSSITHDFYYNN